MTDLLTGIRVLDLTTNIAGPSTTMILADMGLTEIGLSAGEMDRLALRGIIRIAPDP